MLPFFLEQARDLRELADRLRARGARADDPALGLWREAACCHVLFSAGKHDVALARLRETFRAATGLGLLPLPGTFDGAQGQVIAAALFAWCRAALDRRTAA